MLLCKSNITAKNLLLLIVLYITYPKPHHALMVTKIGTTIITKQRRLVGVSPLFAVHRDYHHVLQIAQDAAYKAGEIMRKGSGTTEILKYKGNNPRDIVTELDFKCQEIIQQIISDSFPNDIFLGEEDVILNNNNTNDISSSSSEASISALSNALLQNNYNNDPTSNNNGAAIEKLLWIVDPIDGTTNFQAGLPLFCVSIGVVSKCHSDVGVVVVGVIYNPMLDEMVYAIRGEGCYVNGGKLHPTGSASNIRLRDGLINVGFPGAKESTLRLASRAVGALATKTKGLRMIACASQVMSWVAQNKFNAYISWDLNSWDICAGLLIVEEAGGYISDMQGNKATIQCRDLIICSSSSANSSSNDNTKSLLHVELLQVLTDNQCITYD